MQLNGYPHIYETDRLTIRPLNLDDTGVWRSFLAHPETTRYFPKLRAENPRLQSLFWIERQIKRYRDGKGGLMALIEKGSGKFIGQSGLTLQEIDGNAEVEVGYHLLPEYWGTGYATEAARFFKSLGQEKFGVSRIISIIEENNEPSKKVAIRNGMKEEKRTQWRGLEVVIFT